MSLVIDYDGGPTWDRIVTEGTGPDFEYLFNLPPWTPIVFGGWVGPPPGPPTGTSLVSL